MSTCAPSWPRSRTWRWIQVIPHWYNSLCRNNRSPQRRPAKTSSNLPPWSTWTARLPKAKTPLSCWILAIRKRKWETAVLRRDHRSSTWLPKMSHLRGAPKVALYQPQLTDQGRTIRRPKGSSKSKTRSHSTRIKPSVRLGNSLNASRNRTRSKLCIGLTLSFRRRGTSKEITQME